MKWFRRKFKVGQPVVDKRTGTPGWIVEVNPAWLVNVKVVWLRAEVHPVMVRCVSIPFDW